MFRSRTALLVASLSLVVASCDDATAPNTAPAVQTTQDLSAAAGPQERVTGAAHMTLPQTATEHYQFSAIRHHDGTVSGQFELYTTEVGGIRIHGEVSCFLIQGNTAWIAGIITKSTEESFIGLPARWMVTDNGEGANDPPDLSSDFYLGGNPQRFCTGVFTLPLLTVESGNIQVH